MKKTLFFLILSLLLTNCKEKKRQKLSEPEKGEKTNIKLDNNTENKNIKKIDTVNKYKKDNQVKRKISKKKDPKIVYHNQYSNLFSFNHHKIKDYLDLNLSFKLIVKSEFSTFKEQYDNKIINSNIIKEGFIELTISDSVYKFNTKSKVIQDLYHDYFGYLKPVNSYIIGAKGEGIYEIYLLDKENGLIFGADVFDFNVEIPLISPENSRILFYSSSLIDGGSYVAVSNRSNKKTVKSIYDFSYKVFKWGIEDIVWIDDNSIALRICDNFEYKIKNGKEIKELKNERYLKAILID